MKSLSVLLLVVVVAEARQVCVPGTTFKRSCNTCFCNSAGTGASCTLKGCLKGTPLTFEPAFELATQKPSNDIGALKLEKRSKRQTETRQVCIPNTPWPDDCNACFCNSEGTGVSCTRMACLPKDFFTNRSPTPLVTEKPSIDNGPSKLENRSKRQTETRQVCTPNATWNDGCNSCFCNSEGTAVGCTRKACLPKDFFTNRSPTPLVTEKPLNDNGALKLEKRSKRQTETRQVCIPNTTWKQECNTCFCNSEGTGAGCTLMACLPKDFFTNHSPTLLVTEKPSNEKGALKLSKRSYSIRQSVYGELCEPGTIVKDNCNTCVCNKLGRVGRCTRMFCDEEVYSEGGSYRFSPNGIFKN